MNTIIAKKILGKFNSLETKNLETYVEWIRNINPFDQKEGLSVFQTIYNDLEPDLFQEIRISKWILLLECVRILINRIKSIEQVLLATGYEEKKITEILNHEVRSLTGDKNWEIIRSDDINLELLVHVYGRGLHKLVPI